MGTQESALNNSEASSIRAAKMASTMAMKQVGFAAAQCNQLRAKNSTPALPARVARKTVVCSASNDKSANAVTAVALAAVVSSTAAFVVPEPAHAEVSGLTPCAKSKPFKKRAKVTVRKLAKRQDLYEKGSAPYVALQDRIDQTNARFDKYAKQGLLCGADGYPHLIVDGDFKYGLEEFTIPGIAFLYIAGWIGYVGRQYLNEIKKEKDPKMKEIIIDVPLAVKFASRGWTWPLLAFKELKDGTQTAAKEDVTVSPR